MSTKPVTGCCWYASVVGFITQPTAYVFGLGDVEDEVSREDQRRLGPVHPRGVEGGGGGRLGGGVARSSAAAQRGPRTHPAPHHSGLAIRSYESAREAAELHDRVRLIVSFESNSNLVCLALNRNGNTSIAWMNCPACPVPDRLKVDAGQPVQDPRFIWSYTSLRREGGKRSSAAGSGRHLHPTGHADEPVLIRWDPADAATWTRTRIPRRRRSTQRRRSNRVPGGWRCGADDQASDTSFHAAGRVRRCLIKRI